MSLTYKEFLKKGIDLTPLGIEQRSCVPYFCTPKGADIIGSAGVDGIHFCFIKGFDEMVFAVSPMNGVGNFVHPIARSFEDLLSLLVSCADVAALEQAWLLSKNRFYQFLQENPFVKEQEQTIQALQYDLSIPFIEEPFDYIKALQAEFNYSKIKFTDEYYAVVGDAIEDAGKAEKWQVYYDSGFWKAHADRTRPGKEIALSRKFTWGDEIWHIPAMYVCSKGFAIDYCVEIQPEKIEEFNNKWAWVQFNEENISRETQRQIEQENPLSIDVYSHFTLNGKVVYEKSSSALCYIPCAYLPHNVENVEETLSIIEHYKLDPTKAWFFNRRSCTWQTTRKPKEIKSLCLRLERRPETIQGIHFKNPSVGDTITFTHPISGIEHKLTVLEYGPQELSAKAFAGEIYEFPTHNMAMTYTLEPALSATAFTVRDCLENDELRFIPKNPYEPEAKYDASIGIIGGADGPTAIIMSQKKSDGELHAALSALHFEPTYDIEWKIEFREKMIHDIKVDLI